VAEIDGLLYKRDMTRPADFLTVLENDDAPAVTIDDARGELLVQLLVHMFFADDELHDKEVELLGRLIGGDSADALRDKISGINASPMDWDKLAATFSSHQDRLDIITVAEHGFWADNQMKFSEMDVLDITER
jgi:hypothetical protein